MWVSNCNRNSLIHCVFNMGSNWPSMRNAQRSTQAWLTLGAVAQEKAELAYFDPGFKWWN